MARLSAAMLVMFIVVFASCFCTLDARKLLNDNINKKAPSLEASLVFSALPKGTMPTSSPSKKGHAMIIDEQLFVRHLENIDRIMMSVPSPGVGH